MTAIFFVEIALYLIETFVMGTANLIDLAIVGIVLLSGLALYDIKSMINQEGEDYEVL